MLDGTCISIWFPDLRNYHVGCILNMLMLWTHCMKCYYCQICNAWHLSRCWKVKQRGFLLQTQVSQSLVDTSSLGESVCKGLISSICHVLQRWPLTKMDWRDSWMGSRLQRRTGRGVSLLLITEHKERQWRCLSGAWPEVMFLLSVCLSPQRCSILMSVCWGDSSLHWLEQG